MFYHSLAKEFSDATHARAAEAVLQGISIALYPTSYAHYHTKKIGDLFFSGFKDVYFTAIKVNTINNIGEVSNITHCNF